jgi:hypothetical protein
MKLSNRILIGFFGFLFIYLIAAFTEIRFRGNLNHLGESTGLVETADLSGFTYLIIQDLDESVTLVAADVPGIEVRSISGDLLKNLKYHVKGDTLELAQLQLEENVNLNLTVYVPRNSLTGMTIYDVSVVIKGMDQKQLAIKQQAGSIRFVEGNRLEKLSIQATDDGNLNFSGHHLDTVSIQLNNSNVHIESGTSRVEGKMVNESYLWIRDVNEIDFTKDETCRLIIN